MPSPNPGSVESAGRCDPYHALLACLGVTALKEPDVDLFLSACIPQAADVLNVEFSAALEVLPPGQELLLRAGIGWNEGCVGSSTVDAGDRSQARFTLTANAPVIVDDLSAEERFRASGLLLDHGVVSSLSVVIPGPERPYGILGFHTTRRRTFSDDEVYFTQAIAHLAGAALQRKHTEENLRRSHREVEDFVENATVGLHRVGADGTILWANRAELDLLGYTRDEYVGRHIAEFHVDQPIIEDVLRRLAQGEALHDCEARLRHKDGSILHVLISSNVWFQNGEFIHTRCFTRDVTTHRRMERAMRESETRLRQLLTVMPAAVYTCDAEGRITYFNAQAVTMWGREPEPGESDERYCGSLRLFHDDGKPLLHEETPMALAVRTGRRTRNQEVVIERPDGSTVVASVNVDPLFDQDGNQGGAINVFYDVTELKRARDALRRSEEEYRQLSRTLEARVAERTAALQQRNQELQDFAHFASHDLREPLRKVVTFTELALASEEGAGEEHFDYLERTRAAAFRMMGLLDDLLLFARLTAFEEPFSEVDLSLAARDVLTDLEVVLHEKDGAVNLDSLPVVEASPSQMRQLFQNLIGNALKFHRPGVPPEIHVSAETVSNGHDATNAVVRLHVEDNGLGFEKKYADLIFQPFQRLHGRSAYEGTGLGLAICRTIVQRHGGTISAASTPGEGSRFTVELPLRHEA